MVARALILLLALQQQPAQKNEPSQKQSKKPDVVVIKPEAPPGLELETEAVKEYSFNPLQARKEMEVGNFHMKRRNYSGAVARFQEALKWNPKLAEAWLRLGDAHSKRGEVQKALEAYRKYLELEPKSKKAPEVQKIITRLEQELRE